MLKSATLMTIKQIVSEFFAIGIHLDALLKVRVKGGERFQYLRICSAKLETRSEMSGIIVQLLVEFTFSLGGICNLISYEQYMFKIILYFYYFILTSSHLTCKIF